MTHLGIDVSGYQWPDNLVSALSSLSAKGGGRDAPFCFVQVDPANVDALAQVAQITAAVEHVKGAGAGAYVYVDWAKPIEAQAQWAIDHTPAHWPVMCDLEAIPPGVPLAAVLAAVDLFARTVEATGRHSGNYTDLSWYEGEGDPTSQPLWLAEPGVSAPSFPCLIWQSGTGTLAGVTGQVDLDTWVGSGPKAVSFAAFFGIAPPPAPPAPPKGDGMAFRAVVVDPTTGAKSWALFPVPPLTKRTLTPEEGPVVSALKNADGSETYPDLTAEYPPTLLARAAEAPTPSP